MLDHKDHKKKNGHPPAPDPREVRRQNMARFGTTMTPTQQVADPALLASALAMCASAGLPDPVITTEVVSPPEGGLDYNVNTYTFVHFRTPPVSCRVTEDQLALYPERVVQLCKNAGIRSDSLPITDDPPIALVAAPPPPPVV